MKKLDIALKSHFQDPKSTTVCFILKTRYQVHNGINLFKLETFTT